MIKPLIPAWLAGNPALCALLTKNTPPNFRFPVIGDSPEVREAINSENNEYFRQEMIKKRHEIVAGILWNEHSEPLK